MTEPGVTKLFNRIRIRKGLTQAGTISINRNQVDLEFLVSRWSKETHTFADILGRIYPFIEGCGSPSLPLLEMLML